MPPPPTFDCSPAPTSPDDVRQAPKITAETPSSWRFARRGWYAPLLVLVPVLIGQALSFRGALPQPGPLAAGVRADQLRAALDPNAAPWWELTALPQIGEVTAQRIVDYRTAYIADWPGFAAFANPADLEQVRGIGPKTVARLTPCLAFDPSAGRAPASE